MKQRPVEVAKAKAISRKQNDLDKKVSVLLYMEERGPNGLLHNYANIKNYHKPKRNRTTFRRVGANGLAGATQ